MGEISIIVGTSSGWITGRNGTFDLSRVHLWQGTHAVFIDGIGQRGKTINGGLGLDTATMDELAARWLTARGYSVKGAEGEWG